MVRTFTGAWIETRTLLLFLSIVPFAPSRVRGLKHRYTAYRRPYLVRTFTGAWIETLGGRGRGKSAGSHLHGCVD